MIDGDGWKGGLLDSTRFLQKFCTHLVTSKGYQGIDCERVRDSANHGGDHPRDRQHRSGQEGQRHK